ncbi:MAG TPA: hypothetical protein VHV51_24945 [Polyangiaceae bacterium]|nr:hypothetical protein [Polyangiaceae bacterium]
MEGHTQHPRRRSELDLGDDDSGRRQAFSSHGAPQEPSVWLATLHSSVTPAVDPNGAQVAPAALPVREDLQQLISGLARRVSWGGDRRRGSVRIELGQGPLAGATLIVHAEERSVSVELELPPGSNLAGDLQQRIRERLEGRGFLADVRIG